MGAKKGHLAGHKGPDDVARHHHGVQPPRCHVHQGPTDRPSQGPAGGPTGPAGGAGAAAADARGGVEASRGHIGPEAGAAGGRAAEGGQRGGRGGHAPADGERLGERLCAGVPARPVPTPVRHLVMR